MYDNAMQAMIRKKEEEFAQLQAMVMPPMTNAGFLGPISPPPNPLEGATNYAPALPVQGLSSGWGQDANSAAMNRGGGPGFGLANRLRYELSVPPPPMGGLMGSGGAFTNLMPRQPEGEYNFLLDIRNRFFPVVDMKALPDHLANLVTNIEGSRFVQENLDRASAQDKENLFKKILPKCTWLAMNVFGNYVIQKYFECGTGQQVMQLFHKILPETRKLTMNKYGSRVVQTAFSYVTPEQHTEWTKEVTKDVIAFCKDANGNHVVQKCMETAEDPTAEHMVDLLNRIQEMAFNFCNDRFGCRVIQKMIQVYTPEQMAVIKNVAHELTNHLMTSNFGNYLIQDLMEYGTSEDRNRVFASCVGKVLQMSHDKFASNIIENVLKKGSLPEKTAIVREVCSVDTLVIMMKDQYGNYVVQRMIETSDATLLRELHHVMLQVHQDVTVSINEKMRKNFAINCQKPAIMLLARTYFDSADKNAEVRGKHVDAVEKIDTWMRQIKDCETLTMETTDVSLLVCVVTDINGGSENPDLAAMVNDLRSYLKCLVQDYCKKNASFVPKLPPPPFPFGAGKVDMTMLPPPAVMVGVPPPSLLPPAASQYRSGNINGDGLYNSGGGQYGANNQYGGSGQYNSSAQYGGGGNNVGGTAVMPMGGPRNVNNVEDVKPPVVDLVPDCTPIPGLD